MSKTEKINPQELARREEVFRIYRDLGRERSYPRLRVAAKARFGDIHERTFSNWSKAHSWKERLAAWDDEARSAALPAMQLDPNFDRREALLTAAHLALTRALQSIPSVRTPQDFKALVDAANNAIKIVELMDRDRPHGLAEAGAAKKRMFQMIDDIEKRIRGAKVIEHEPAAAPAETVMVEAEPKSVAERLAARRRERPAE